MGTDFNYDDTSHQVIFDHINGGSGSESLQEASRAWQQLGDGIGLAGKSYVESAISSTLASREGAAAEAAIAAIGAMLPWMDDVALIATTAAQRAQGQADYWVTAKNSVPPVPPAPRSASFFGDPAEWFVQKMDWFPGLTTEEEKAQQRQQDAAEQARQAMRVYQASSNGNIEPAPAFTAPQALDGSVGSLPLTDPRVAASGATSSAVEGGGAPAHLLAAHQLAAHQLAAHQPATYQPAAYQPAATVSQLAQGGHAGTPGSVAAGSGQWAGNPTASQGMPPGALPIGAGFRDSATERGPARPAPLPGAAGGTRFAGGGRGGGAGHGGFGPRPSAEFGPRPTVSAQPAAEGMSSARSGAGSVGAARGAGGIGYGAPFVGAAGQRGELDREHRSKYLLHDDSNAIVGDLPPTAPPVIGEDY
ncbi:MAG: PPE domain-containing protein [Actinomycetota bacterium]|nr:PPE domain-containing protein [Actinomycetota bacterium]